MNHSSDYKPARAAILFGAILLSVPAPCRAQQQPSHKTLLLETIVENAGDQGLENDIGEVMRLANEYAAVKDANGNMLQYTSKEIENVTFEDQVFKPTYPDDADIDAPPPTFLYGLAILSDDGCKVTINGKEVLTRFGKGQALPHLGQSLSILPVILSSDTPANIKVEYSNIIYRENPNEPDIDGVTLFVYSLPVTLKDVKDSTITSDDVIITPWNTAKQTNPMDANIAWIEAHKSDTDAAPRMPQLELKIGLPTTMTIQAKLEVQYTRGNGARSARNQSEDRVRIPASGKFQTVTGDTWKTWEAYASENFFGGEATLTYKLMTGSTEALGPQIIRFRIGGKNPDFARAKTYIESLADSNSTGSLWFAYAIAKSESKDYNGVGEPDTISSGNYQETI